MPVRDYLYLDQATWGWKAHSTVGGTIPWAEIKDAQKGESELPYAFTVPFYLTVSTT